ncbi:MAG: cytochrome c biogenesis protein ResB [Austwickia sp.]|nr:cytochrome c biogenesis protein ResB [Austwickia sp.]
MRVALFLLLLVAVAAVPGSIWPQRAVDPSRVSTYLQENPELGRWLDRLGMFNVYTSPWFSAIYLLLVISLIGCVIPRTRLHWHALTAPPPRAPARLERLPVHARREVPLPPQEAAQALVTALRRRRYRVRTADAGRGPTAPGEVVISAETGYARESGNLLFHLAILVVIAAIAWGHLVGWRGDRIVVAGQAFSNATAEYSPFEAGPWVDPASLQPFTVQLDSLSVRFEERADGPQYGAPRDFRAQTTVWDTPDAPPQQRPLSVNGPLGFGGTAVYLLANGYAPTITVRDGQGAVAYREPTPFLPQDNVYRSVGVVKVPAAKPSQLGFTGLFLPTAYIDAGGPNSAFPDLRNPELILTAYEGEVYPGALPQSVFALDTSKMTQLKDAKGSPLRLRLRPGDTVALPGGRGSVTFERVDRWAGLSVRYDPAKPLALAGSVAALLGLAASLLVRRRRVFVRIRPAERGAGDGEGGVAGDGERGVAGSEVVVGALAKGEDPMLADAVDRLLGRLRVDRSG